MIHKAYAMSHQIMQMVAADTSRDAHTNDKIWDLTVFTNPIDPNLEEDVQWVFIESLSIRITRSSLIRAQGHVRN